MAEQTFTVECAHCLRKFRWRPELAGKRGKCKCGQTIAFPQTVPEPAVQTVGAPAGRVAPAASPAPQVEILENNYDLAPEPVPSKPKAVPPPLPATGKANVCPQCTVMLAPQAVICTRCGYNIKTGKKMGTKIKGPGPDGADIAKAAGKVVLSMVLGGTVAVIGAIIWIVIIAVTGLQLGFIAWILGLAIGGTMRLINPYGGNASGLAAAGFAFLALAIPKAIFVVVAMKLGLPIFMAFSIFDALWFFLAISTAYKVGGGLT